MKRKTLKRKKVPLNLMPGNEWMNENHTWEKAVERIKKLGLDPDKFADWMYGQTCPMIELGDGTVVGGVYGWDLERWISWQMGGRTPIWD